MLYPSSLWGGGEVSMTYRKTGSSSNDYFVAYLGSHDNALASGYYDYVQAL